VKVLTINVPRSDTAMREPASQRVCCTGIRQCILSLGLDKNVWLVSRPCRFNPNEEAHITHRILGMGRRQADMNIIVDNNILPVPKIEQWLISYIVHSPVTIPAELFREFKIIPFS